MISVKEAWTMAKAKKTKRGKKEMSVEDYMRLPYTRIIRKIGHEDGSCYFGQILELAVDYSITCQMP